MQIFRGNGISSIALYIKVSIRVLKCTKGGQKQMLVSQSKNTPKLKQMNILPEYDPDFVPKKLQTNMAKNG